MWDFKYSIQEVWAKLWIPSGNLGENHHSNFRVQDHTSSVVSGRMRIKVIWKQNKSLLNCQTQRHKIFLFHGSLEDTFSTKKTKTKNPTEITHTHTHTHIWRPVVHTCSHSYLLPGTIDMKLLFLKTVIDSKQYKEHLLQPSGPSMAKLTPYNGENI